MDRPRPVLKGLDRRSGAFRRLRRGEEESRFPVNSHRLFGFAVRRKALGALPKGKRSSQAQVVAGFRRMGRRESHRRKQKKAQEEKVSRVAPF